MGSSRSAWPTREGLGVGTAFNLIARFAFLFSSYALHIGLARILGPAAYGVVGVVLSLVTIARVFITDGTRQAISKFTAENETLASAIRNVALRVQGLISVLVMLALMAGAGVLAQLLRDTTLAPYLRLVAPIVPIMSVFSIYQASLNGMRAFSRQATMMIVYSLGRVALSVLGAWLWGLNGALLGMLSAPIVAVGLGQSLLPVRRSQGTFVARRILIFSIPMVIFAAGTTLLTSLDLFFVKALLGQSAQVGQYTAAATVAQIPYYALLPLVDTLLPVTASLLAEQKRDRARQAIITGLRYGLMLLLPAAALISATAPSLITFLFSRAYSPAAGPLAVLIWGQTFYAFFSVLAALLTAEGKPLYAMTLALSMLPISALLNLVLVPRFGLLGAACATTSATLAGMAGSLVLVQRDFGAVFGARSTLVITIAALLSGAVAFCWRPRGLILVPAYLALWTLDVLLLWPLRELQKSDVLRAMGLVRSLSRREV